MSTSPPSGTTAWSPPAGWNDYAIAERRRATAWKATTSDLPPEAQAPEFYLGPNGEHRSGPFPFCLPRGYASHNLLPLVRDDAIALFHGLDIPWHAGVDNGPSNHLLDSQVQCVNALMPMVTDPDRLIAALGGILDLGEVRPFPDGTYLTFEYIGDRDYLGESPRKPRRRGTRCTSVDAAFQHTAPDGARSGRPTQSPASISFRKR